jgi:hypothetical protein
MQLDWPCLQPSRSCRCGSQASLSTINSETEKLASASADWRRYLAWYLSTLLIVWALVAGFNAIVDPQARFLLVDKPDFNQVKIALTANSRQGKATALRQCGYGTIVLGSSRAESAIAVGHPTLSDAKVYNAALRGGTTYEMRRLTDYAIRHGGLKRVLLGLDYESFNSRILFREDFAESPLAETVSPASIARYLVSLRTFRQSVATLLWNTRGRAVMCGDKGEHQRTYELEAARRTFDFILRRYAEGHYGQYVPGDLHIQHLEALLRESTDAGVAVYAYISPVHVTHLELLAEMNLINDYENWKRQLVRLVTEVNQDFPERQAVLWDFSGYSEITTEKVPDPQQQKFMRWYDDSSHFNKSVGGIILDRMLGAQSGESATEKPFGVVLTSDNIDAQIEADRRNSESYRLNNPDEISRLKEMLDSLE